MAITAPSVATVGSILRARTKTPNGEEAGTFTTETRPTAAQAQELIGLARSMVEGKASPCEGDAFAKLDSWAGKLVAIRAAMLIETSYWPEQVGTEKSAYDSLKDAYEDEMKSYVEAVTERCGGSGGEATGEESEERLARGYFPNHFPSETMRW